MLLSLKDLYSIAKSNTEEVILDEQDNNLFMRCCIAYFSIVNPIVFITNEDMKLQNLHFNGMVNKLNIDMGGFKVIEYDESISYVKIEPTDYSLFLLPTNYQDSFIGVCEYFILTTSIKNMNMIKDNFGMSETLQQPSDINTIREILKREYNVESMAMVSTEDKDK